MKKIPSLVWAIAIVLVGAVYIRACWEPSIRADERRKVVDAGDDSTIARMAAEQFATEARHARDTTALRGELRTLRRKIAPRDSIVLTDTVVVYRELAGRDSVIAGLDSLLALSDGQARFWRAQAVSYRDTLVPKLVAARDSWRKSAQRPRHTITDILGGAALGYGLAKNSEIAAGVGGALILVPRVVDFVGRIF